MSALSSQTGQIEPVCFSAQQPGPRGGSLSLPRDRGVFAAGPAGLRSGPSTLISTANQDPDQALSNRRKIKFHAILTSGGASSRGCPVCAACWVNVRGQHRTWDEALGCLAGAQRTLMQVGPWGSLPGPLQRQGPLASCAQKGLVEDPAGLPGAQPLSPSRRHPQSRFVAPTPWGPGAIPPGKCSGQVLAAKDPRGICHLCTPALGWAAPLLRAGAAETSPHKQGLRAAEGPSAPRPRSPNQGASGLAPCGGGGGSGLCPWVSGGALPGTQPACIRPLSRLPVQLPL